MRMPSMIIRSTIILASACRIAGAGHFMADTTVSGLRIELHAVPAEPFFTKDEAAEAKVTDGMLILGGEKPLAPDSETRPNRHLVVHVYDAKTGKAVTGAKVKMNFRSLDSAGNASGNPTEVPVVIMQAIGKDAQSTHYGNNVKMPDGGYIVSVVANDKAAGFKINLTSAPDASMEKTHMH